MECSDPRWRRRAGRLPNTLEQGPFSRQFDAFKYTRAGGGPAGNAIAFWRRLICKEYEEAIAAGREALKVYQKQSWPIYWAGTQSEVAVNLEQLGELNANQDDLKQAITLERQVLDGYPREHNPVLWAAIQTDLGHALVGAAPAEQGPGVRGASRGRMSRRAGGPIDRA
jgi:tetratricopeptide (TPR) repeat protein